MSEAAVDLAIEPTAPPVQMPWRPKWTPKAVPWADCTRARREDLHVAWSIGELGHLLTPSQTATDAKMNAWNRRVAKQLKKAIDLRAAGAGVEHISRTFVLDSSRRWGKSQLLIKRALEKGIQNKSWRMIYMGPIYKELMRIVPPLMARLVQDCPPGLLGPSHGPKWVKTEGAYVFSNGSRLEIVGLDENPDGARGTGVDAVFGDEMAFFGNLEYLLQSIIKPQMLGRLHARIECASTPPTSPSHYWTQTLVDLAVRNDAHDMKTIEQADQYETYEIEEFIAEAGGRDSTTCQREYFCRHITDETMAVIPEFRKAEATAVRVEEPPQWRFCYAAMDPGWKDNTGVLFGYWDWDRKWCCVEDEVCESRLNSEDILTRVKRVEHALWNGVKRRDGDTGRLKPQPLLRVTDRDGRLQQDLAMAGVVFAPTMKDKKLQQVDALRVAFTKGQIVIHPRCKKLINQLRNAVWKNKTMDKFAWEGGEMGHYDLVDALIYMWRAMQQRQRMNPYPTEHYYVNGKDHDPNHGKQAPGNSRWQYSRGRFAVR